MAFIAAQKWHYIKISYVFSHSINNSIFIVFVVVYSFGLAAFDPLAENVLCVENQQPLLPVNNRADFLPEIKRFKGVSIWAEVGEINISAETGRRTQGLTQASQDPGPDQLPQGPPSLGPAPRDLKLALGVQRGQDQAADRGQGNPGACHDRDQGQVLLPGPSLDLGPGLGAVARVARGQPRGQRKAQTLRLRENPGKRGS